MAVIPSVSVVHGKVCPGERTVHLDRRCGDCCHTLGCNLQVLCHNKCWTVLGEGGGCWTAQVWRSVCVCMCACAIFIKTHRGNAVSLIYDRGKALVAATFPGSRLRWGSHMCAVVRARPSHVCLQPSFCLQVRHLQISLKPSLKPFEFPVSWRHLFPLDVCDFLHA